VKAKNVTDIAIFFVFILSPRQNNARPFLFHYCIAGGPELAH
jgi:hypothetical protein